MWPARAHKRIRFPLSLPPPPPLAPAHAPPGAGRASSGYTAHTVLCVSLKTRGTSTQNAGRPRGPTAHGRRETGRSPPPHHRPAHPPRRRRHARHVPGRRAAPPAPAPPLRAPCVQRGPFLPDELVFVRGDPALRFRECTTAPTVCVGGRGHRTQIPAWNSISSHWVGSRHLPTRTGAGGVGGSVWRGHRSTSVRRRRHGRLLHAHPPRPRPAANHGGRVL